VYDLRGGRDFALLRLSVVRDWVDDETDGALELPSPAEVYDDYEEFLDTVTVIQDHELPWLAGDKPIIFEGAQGVLLDEDFGFHPHTTWSHTTTRNAELIAQAQMHLRQHDVFKLGVVRT
jgi:adenylosuccinate synthase